MQVEESCTNQNQTGTKLMAHLQPHSVTKYLALYGSNLNLTYK